MATARSSSLAGFDSNSAQILSDVIGAVYDCVLEPERWRETVQQVATLCESPIAALGIQDLEDQSKYRRVFDHGYDPSFWAHYDRFVAFDPIFPSAALLGVGEAATQAMLCGEEEFFESRFYRECLKPYGYRDTIGFLALRSGARVAFLAACRTDRDPRFGDHELRLFNLLAPHVCRALKISDALDLRTLTCEGLEATLDGLVAGVYLTTRDARVVHMNRAAERQVKASNALRIVNNRICATDSAASAALAKAIADAAADEAHAPVGGHSLAIPDSETSGFVATIMPLERGQRKSFAAPFAAAVAVFVQDPAAAPQFPGEAFAKLYGLSGGELRVLLAMAPGLGIKDAADMLGIGENTAKTHLQHIFSKTGTSRQAELVNLLKNSTPPIRAE